MSKQIFANKKYRVVIEPDTMASCPLIDAGSDFIVGQFELAENIDGQFVPCEIIDPKKQHKNLPQIFDSVVDFRKATQGMVVYGIRSDKYGFMDYQHNPEHLKYCCGAIAVKPSKKNKNKEKSEEFDKQRIELLLEQLIAWYGNGYLGYVIEKKCSKCDSWQHIDSVYGYYGHKVTEQIIGDLQESEHFGKIKDLIPQIRENSQWI